MNRNRWLFLALRTGARLLPHVPLRLAYAAAVIAGTLSYALFSGPREAIEGNLSVALGLPRRDRRVRRYARHAFCNDAKNWIDTLRIGSVRSSEISRSLLVAGWDLLVAQIERGKGLILVTLHLGNFDLVGQVIADRGYHLTVPVERMEPAELFDFLVSLRASHGIHIVPVERAPRDMLLALRRGEIVGLAGDRALGGRGISVPFFGRPALFPQGPASLARRTGAPLLVAVGTRRADNSFDGHIIGPIEIQRTDDGDRDDFENTVRIVHEMESLIVKYPGQWLSFSPIWPATRDESAARIDTQLEAPS